MPTGYTVIIKENDATFEEFVWRCARAMTALGMRDEYFDIPIPKQFYPSNYHAKELEAARERLFDLERMSFEEADAEAKAEYDAAVKKFTEVQERKTRLADRYRRMIDKVKAWQPPTPDHEGLKEFMLEQLNLSLWDDTDCRVRQVLRLSTAEWLKQKIAQTLKTIDYHSKEQREEDERVARQNAWMKALKASVPVPK